VPRICLSEFEVAVWSHDVWTFQWVTCHAEDSPQRCYLDVSSGSCWSCERIFLDLWLDPAAKYAWLNKNGTGCNGDCYWPYRKKLTVGQLKHQELARSKYLEQIFYTHHIFLNKTPSKRSLNFNLANSYSSIIFNFPTPTTTR
jgi:hypothetical protein